MNGKASFTEDFESELTDPLATGHKDFDWEGLGQLLGETEAMPEQEWQRVQDFVRHFFLWISKGIRRDRNADRYLGRKVFAMLWVFDPSLIDNTPSLSAIARQLGTNKEALSLHSSDARRKFGIKNRAQSHGWNYDKDKPQRGQDETECASSALSQDETNEDDDDT